MVEEYHAVGYHGQSKKRLQEHLLNRKNGDIKKREELLDSFFRFYNEKNTNNIYKKMVVHNTFDTFLLMMQGLH